MYTPFTTAARGSCRDLRSVLLQCCCTLSNAYLYIYTMYILTMYIRTFQRASTQLSFLSCTLTPHANWKQNEEGSVNFLTVYTEQHIPPPDYT